MPSVASTPDPHDEPNKKTAVPEEFVPAEGDCRLYQPDGEEWSAHIMRGSERQYCYLREPGKDYFHLIVPGEIYIQRGDEKLCLMCAVREGVLTTNRLFWQFPWRKKPSAARKI